MNFSLLLRSALLRVAWAGLCVLVMGSLWLARAADPGGEFAWQNPLPVGTSGINGFRDPFILKEGNTWYMTGTGIPFYQETQVITGPPKGVPLYSSANLRTWKFESTIVPRVEGSWYQDHFWAPEIHAKDTPAGRKFYCTFNCVNKARGTRGVGLAVADKITGPYRLTTPDAGLFNGNDGTLFTDDDGQDYLFVTGVKAMKVDLENAKVVGEAWDCIGPGAPEDWDTNALPEQIVGREGPQVIKIAGTYYCFYSSWARGYEVGYATAKNLRGPWTKGQENPIYGAQAPTNCRSYRKPYTQGPEVPFKGAGHGQPFVGPDGRWWLSVHYELRDPPPGAEKIKGWAQPGYDPLVFKDGEFERTAPTWTPQSVRLPRVP